MNYSSRAFCVFGRACRLACGARQVQTIFLVLTLALALPLTAQDARWKELIAQVQTLYKQGKYAEGIPLAQEAVRIGEGTYGADHLNVAVALNNLADLYRVQGKYADAEPLYKRSLAIREKALGPDHPEVATALNNLALLYHAQGKYADAEPLNKRSLAILEKALGPDHPAVATSLSNLGSLYQAQGKYADAEPLYKRSSAIQEKALGPDHPAVATSLNNLADLYRVQGKYADAELLYKRSLAIREKALGPDHSDVANSLSNLAVLYGAQGKYADAEPLYKRSLAIREKALGPGHPDVADSLGNLGSLYQAQGKYADAEPLYKRSLAILEKALGPDHPDVATSLSNLAVLYQGQGKYTDAEPLYKRSLAIREKALGPGHPDVANSLGNLGVLYQAQGKYADAEPLYKRSLAIREKTLGPDHPDVATSLSNLAELYQAQGKYAEAEPLLERVLRNLLRQFDYSFTYMSERDQLQFLNKVQLYFARYLSFCLENREQDPTLVGKMFDVLLWEKGLVVASVAAIRARVAASGAPDALKLFDQLTAKRSESSRLATTRPAGWVQLRKTVDEEGNDLEQQLARRVSSLAQRQNLAHASWRDVRQILQLGEAAVEFVHFRYNDGKRWTDTFYYAALVITPETKSAPTLVLLGEAKNLEADPLGDYRLQVGLPENPARRGVRIKSGEEKIGGAPKTSFYAAFWKPLEPALGGAKRIYLSPDGVLDQVALGDVAAPEGRLLMEKYDLRIVSSTRDILQVARKLSSNTGVLVGNPTFDLEEAGQREALRLFEKTQKQEPAVMESSRGARSRDLRGGMLPSLPGTEAEVRAISSLLEGKHWDVRTYVQQNALKEAVMSVKGPRVLHLATHGFFEADQQPTEQVMATHEPSGLEDPMLRSGLFFAGADRTLRGQPIAPDLDDGVLTAYEVANMNLEGTELVVLSACDTGLGQVATGEGVFGLRRAVQAAGAEAVLMSMWSVPDKETQELMTMFYEKWLAGKDKHLALQEAELEMRKRVEQRYGRDIPLYWGGFVLVGR